MHRGRLRDERLPNRIGRSHRRMKWEEGLALSDNAMRYGYKQYIGAMQKKERCDNNIKRWICELIGQWTGWSLYRVGRGEGFMNLYICAIAISEKVVICDSDVLAVKHVIWGKVQFYEKMGICGKTEIYEKSGDCDRKGDCDNCLVNLVRSKLLL